MSTDATDPTDVDDEQLRRTIRDLLSARAATSSICPSDAARAACPTNWRPLMDPVRRVAAELVEAGEVEVTQGGEVVDPGTARGPIRIRWPRPTE